MTTRLLSSPPNDKILGLTKLAAFAYNKINETQMGLTVFDRVENIAEKKEKMLVSSIFSFSHNVLKGFFVKFIKAWDCLVKGWNTSVLMYKLIPDNKPF